MHNLIALSLGLPGTPLHGLNDCDPRTHSTSPPPPAPPRRGLSGSSHGASLRV